MFTTASPSTYDNMDLFIVSFSMIWCGKSILKKTWSKKFNRIIGIPYNNKDIIIIPYYWLPNLLMMIFSINYYYNINNFQSSNESICLR